MDALDESCRQFENPAQLGFFPRHPSIIALVIETRQMQDSVQDQDLDFIGGRMAKPGCVFGGDFRADGDLSARDNSLASHRSRRKRQDIGRLIFPTELPVQPPHRPGVRYQNMGQTAQFRGAPGSRHESLQ